MKQRPASDAPTPSTLSTQRTLDSIRRIVRALRLSSRSAEKELGLSGAQLFVLQKLKDGGSLSVTELAEKTLTHQSSVSVVVSRLLEKGLIIRRRSREDARRAILSLSRKGEAFLRDAPITAQERLLEALGLLPDRERARLAELLERVLEKSGFSEEPAALFFEEEK